MEILNARDFQMGISLEYDAAKYKIHIKCCSPMHLEVKTLPIQWIDCHIKDFAIDDGSKLIQKDYVKKQHTVLTSPNLEEEDLVLRKVNQMEVDQNAECFHYPIRQLIQSNMIY
eukprot:2551192-Ditylum_brightwellii.AAC.1